MVGKGIYLNLLLILLRIFVSTTQLANCRLSHLLNYCRYIVNVEY